MVSLFCWEEEEEYSYILQFCFFNHIICIFTGLYILFTQIYINIIVKSRIFNYHHKFVDHFQWCIMMIVICTKYSNSLTCQDKLYDLDSHWLIRRKPTCDWCKHCIEAMISQHSICQTVSKHETKTPYSVLFILECFRPPKTCSLTGDS